MHGTRKIVTDADRQAARERRRRSYARRCRGRSVLSIEVDYDATIAALLEASEAQIRDGDRPLLSEVESRNRVKVEAAVAEIVRIWVQRWLNKL